MSEKRLNNTIFLMFLVSGAYCSAHNLTQEQFLALDKVFCLNMVSLVGMLVLYYYYCILLEPLN